MPGITAQHTGDLQHQIAADDNAIGGDIGVQQFGDALGLGGGQGGDHPRRGVTCHPRDDGVLVHIQDTTHLRLDTGAPQHVETPRGGAEPRTRRVTCARWVRSAA